MDTETIKKLSVGLNPPEEKNIPSYDDIKNKTLKDIKSLAFDLYSNNDPRSKIEAEEIIVEYLKNKFKIKNIENDQKKEVWIYNDGIYIDNGISIIKKEIRKILGKSYEENKANKIVDKIITDTGMRASEFFGSRYPYLLPVKNGILNIKTGELKDFNPEYIFFTKIKHNYNPKSKCPNIINHLNNVLEKDDDILQLQEAIGNCLYKDYTFEKAIMFEGRGRNGKSITLELIEILLGNDNISCLNLQELKEKGFEMSNLHGKLANIAGDIPSTPIDDASVFKHLTGNNTFTAQRKFMTSLQFVNYAKFFFSCNERPLSYDNTDGFFSRWLTFKFPYRFVSKNKYNPNNKYEKLKDRHIKEKIHTKEEMEGFLNFALEGIQRLLIKGEFTNEPDVEELKKEYIYSSDPIRKYLDENIIKDNNSYISKEEFRQRVHEYCDKNNINQKISDKHIYTTLTNNYGVVFKQIMREGERIRVWLGIKFKEVEF